MGEPLIHYYSGESKVVEDRLYPVTICGLYTLYPIPDMEDYLTENLAEVTCPKCRRLLNESL